LRSSPLPVAPVGLGHESALELAPADWRAAGAALAFLAKKVRAAEDRDNAKRLQDLAGKAEGIADLCDRILAFAEKLLGEDEAESDSEQAV